MKSKKTKRMLYDGYLEYCKNPSNILALQLAYIAVKYVYSKKMTEDEMYEYLLLNLKNK